jgi:CHAT domain-containing protein
VIIEYVVIDSSISAFLITNRRVEFLRNLATTAELISSLEGLRFQFSALRFGADAIGRFAGQLKDKADRYLRCLYDKLLAPIRRRIKSPRLVIVPASVLNYIPFPALYDGRHYLSEQLEVSIAPSASVWLALATKAQSRGSRDALFIGYADESIPLAEKETIELAKKLQDSMVFTGRDATFASYIENAPRAGIIHLACHGQFRTDNPLFSSQHLSDGWITVRDICRQKLKTRLVTLSACETGLNIISPGEEMLGLTRGFLTAGTQALVVSLWTVNDEATAQLMDIFYANLQRGTTPIASLRVAQTAFIERGVHPYFWSPFIAIGV